jgi:5-methylcytosine-specific restriction endonuclease McrA
MPSRPPSICRCGHVVPPGTKCDCARQREQERKARHEARRPSARQRGYTQAWAKASKAFLARPENEFCACGCGREADMVDHRIAHRGDPRLFWAETNWQPMASICNRRKAVREEGAFGRPKVDQGIRAPGAGREPQPAPYRDAPSRAELPVLKKRICSDGD